MSLPRPLRTGLSIGALGWVGVASASGAQQSAAPTTPRVPLQPVASPAFPMVPLTAPSGVTPATSRVPRTTWVDRLVLAGEFAHLGAGPIDRHAGRSMDATAGYDLRGVRDASAPRATGLRFELGWLRAARPAATAQGATAGLSLGLAVPHTARRLTLRPGVALLGGWAESQGDEWYYDWRGVPGTAASGQSGTVVRPRPVRSAAFGVGAAVAGAFDLGAGVALTGALRPWTFAGSAAQPLHGVTTLAGVGLSVRPAAWKRRARAERPAASSVASVPNVPAPNGSTPNASMPNAPTDGSRTGAPR